MTKMTPPRTAAEHYLQKRQKDPIYAAAYERARRRVDAVDTVVRTLDSRRENLGLSKAEVARRAQVRHSLAHGFVQGWDLHPSHLVSRYATVYAHLLDGIDDVLERLAAWQSGVQSGGVMDEPATITVLERQVQRAVDCGAVDHAAS